MLDLIAGENTISPADMNQFKGAMLFTAQDIMRMLTDKNKQVERFNTL